MAISSFKDLRFPDNVGTNDVPNYISFSPMITTYGGTKITSGANPVSINNSATGQTGGLGSLSVSNNLGNPQAIFGNIQSAVSGISGGISEMVNIAETAAGNIRRGADPIKETLGAVGKLAKLSGFEIETALNKTLSDGIKTDADTVNTLGTISLYLPQNLETNSSVDYETAALGGIGSRAAEAVSEADASKFSNLFPGLGLGVLQDLLSGGNRRAVMGITTNRVTNNFSFQVFNSVLHRQFAYEFRMMPKNPVETNVIKKICDMFLYYMLPARTSTDDNIGMYEIPCMWKIAYKRQGKPLQFHQQPRNCFLTSVDVGYGGDAGNSTYNDGGPMEVTLRLQFVEIEPLYRQDGGGQFKGGGAAGVAEGKVAGPVYNDDLDEFGNASEEMGQIDLNKTSLP